LKRRFQLEIIHIQCVRRRVFYRWVSKKKDRVKGPKMNSELSKMRFNWKYHSMVYSNDA
jgi:hypothetical protein